MPKMSDQLRKHLEWSWNYSVAEGFAEDTTRHNAQAIGDGIARGEDQTDDDLLRDFCESGHADEQEWEPEQAETKDELKRLLAEMPHYCSYCGEWGCEEHKTEEQAMKTKRI